MAKEWYDPQMSLRGIWIAFVAIAVAFTGFLLLPDRYAAYLVVPAILAAWYGGFICLRDYLAEQKRFERARDEFNRKLQKRR